MRRNKLPRKKPGATRLRVPLERLQSGGDGALPDLDPRAQYELEDGLNELWVLLRGEGSPRFCFRQGVGAGRGAGGGGEYIGVLLLFLQFASKWHLVGGYECAQECCMSAAAPSPRPPLVNIIALFSVIRSIRTPAWYISARRICFCMSHEDVVAGHARKSNRDY